MEQKEATKTYSLESIGTQVDKISGQLDAMQKATERGKRTATAYAIIGVMAAAVFGLMIAGGTTHDASYNWGAIALLVITLAVTVPPERSARRRELKSLNADDEK